MFMRYAFEGLKGILKWKEYLFLKKICDYIVNTLIKTDVGRFWILKFADFNKIFSFLQKIECNKLFRSLTTYFWSIL